MDVAPEILSKPYIAINTIDCRPEYCGRFEELFATRAHAIDRMPGFITMQVLKCEKVVGRYLVVSQWQNKAQFDAWVGSPEFIEGHKRGFQDLQEAKERGDAPPMVSDFQTFHVIAS